ncbi:hypothetical protein FRX31_033088 [Thalictrum thalictroides]|uniref:Uncharacterized protein n=1 Tax=Thalictrum thalictroides TaxID=46969 RepID=A0A7J6UXJ0_THATH|nr:hypothetical protein FRX31_033088 [Thalictrum thalictroides]
MAQKIRHYRSTIPERIQNSFSSLLAAQRPILLPSPAKFAQPPGTSSDPNSDTGDNAESSKGELLAEVNSETTEKLNLLKHKISNNISTMPTLLKRMNDCILMFDKLDTYNSSTVAIRLLILFTPQSTDTGDNAESSKGELLAEVNSETTEKLNLLKHKISNNISTMPTLLKRMNDCILMFDKLDTYNVSIHPAFKRKRTG